MTSPSKPVERKRSRRIWLFRLIALSFPLLLLFLIELGLHFTGVGYPTGFLVPHPNKAGYLIDNYKFAWRFFPKSLARAPRPIVVQQDKPKGVVRILVFGGSAAMGDPEPAYGMPRVLDVLLSARFPERDFEIVNCAVTAINSHVVRDIASDCRQLNADAWIVYLGNNEVHGPFGAGTVFGSHDKPLWLNRMSLRFQKSKLGQACSDLQEGGTNESSPREWGGMEMFLNQQVRHDEDSLQRVYADFEKNLSAVATECPGNVSLLLSTVVSNLRDFPPFISLHRRNLADDALAHWNELWQRGIALQAEGNSASAMEVFKEAAKLDDSFAELNYRLAECLLLENDATSARVQFQAARDHDALRFRADTRINQIIRNVAGDVEARLVDASKLLADASPDGIPGDGFLYEHVHLNFSGNYLLAKEFAISLTDACSLEGREDNGTWMTEQECAAALGLSPFHARLTLLDVRGRLRLPPFNSQLRHAARDADLTREISELTKQMTPSTGKLACEQLLHILEKRPNDWLCRKQLALLYDSMGELKKAAEQYAIVAETLPHNAESQFRLGAQYNRLKQREDAESALRKAISLRPDFARAYNSLGICLSHQERFDECYAQFARATELQPTFAEAFVNWGLVLANQGDADAAREKYRQATEADPNYAPGHNNLGKSYVAANNYQDAKPHYEAVAKLLPHDLSAQLNLGMLYMRFGGHNEMARRQFLRCLELDPSNALATEGLRRLNGI